MQTYIVTNKETGAEVHRYQGDAMIEWDGMALATHDHTPFAEPEPDAPVEPPAAAWYINVGPFFDRFGAWKLPILSSADPLVQAVIKDSSVREYIDLKGRRAELLQVIGLLQSKGFDVNAVAILDVLPTESEVFNG